jgi:hypothetical protein
VKRLVCVITATGALLAAPGAMAAGTRARIVSLAVSQIGYREPGNFCTKYGPCEEWCSLFVTWVWRQEGVPVPSLAFTGYMYDWARQTTAALAPGATPKPGDAVLYGTGPWTVPSSRHTGIVEAVYPGYLVTVEGDVIHGVRRFVVPTARPQRIGEPGPIYGYAEPIRPAARAARASAALRFAPMSPALLSAQATMSPRRTDPLVRTIASLRAFQHMPYRMAHAQIAWTGVNAQGDVEVSVSSSGSLQTAQASWKKFLHRFHDAGHAYQVTFHAAATPPSAGPPLSAAPPSILGLPAQGQTLTELHGTWTNNPTSYAYQWEDCDQQGNSCTPILGATQSTYTLSAADVGHTVRVQEIASNPSGAGQASASAQTGVVQASLLGL